MLTQARGNAECHSTFNLRSLRVCPEPLRECLRQVSVGFWKIKTTLFLGVEIDMGIESMK
jgi:hypothetical protein